MFSTEREKSERCDGKPKKGLHTNTLAFPYGFFFTFNFIKAQSFLNVVKSNRFPVEDIVEGYLAWNR